MCLVLRREATFARPLLATLFRPVPADEFVAEVDFSNRALLYSWLSSSDFSAVNISRLDMMQDHRMLHLQENVQPVLPTAVYVSVIIKQPSGDATRRKKLTVKTLKEHNDRIRPK